MSQKNNIENSAPGSGGKGGVTHTSAPGPIRRQRPGRRGAVMIMFVISALSLLAVTGLALDGGLIFIQKVWMQFAADSGAKSGALELVRGNMDLSTNIRPAALNDTGLNGYTEADSTIFVNYPPESGPAAGSPAHVEVIIERPVPTTFLRLVGVTESTVRARAVAGAVPAQGFARGVPCILALDPEAEDALIIRGTPTIDVNCGIMSNSTHPTRGLRIAGNSSVDATWIGTSGGYTKNGAAGGVSPPPQEQVPYVPDPLATFQGPTGWETWEEGYYDRAARRVVCPNGRCRFPDTLTVNGPPGARTFDPGTYVLQNGMELTGANQITGEELFFYNVSDTTGIRIAGANTVDFTPQTWGPYKGVLMYGDRNTPYINNDIGRGAATFRFRGALYFPSQHLDWAGTSFGDTPWAYVIARTQDYAGTNDLFLADPPDGASETGLHPDNAVPFELKEAVITE